MPGALAVDRITARRFLVRRHLLAPPRALPAGPDSVRRVVERLGSLQFDPLDVTGRNHDLVLAARIDGYRREWTDALLYEERWLYESYNKGLSLLPSAELPYYRLDWDRRRAAYEATTFVEHADLVGELIERVTREGPLSSSDFETREVANQPSGSNWRPTNQVRAMFEALALAGTLGVARRDGNLRRYDLAERLFPHELLAERRPEDEQRRHKLLSRYRAHGLLGARGGRQEIWIGTTATAAERYRHCDVLIESGALTRVSVEGVRGDRLVLTDELPMLEDAAGAGAGVALLAPLDPFVWDRDLLRSLFDFDYVWEVYVPAAKRRWGYYVLPLLFGDRLVGRIEPRIDRKMGSLAIVDVWWESGFRPLDEPGFVDAFADALHAHARFLDAGRVVWPRRHRALGAAVKERFGPRWSVPPRVAAAG